MHNHLLNLVAVYAAAPVGIGLFLLFARVDRQDRRNSLRYGIMRGEQHLPPEHRSDLRYLERRRRHR